MPIRSRPLLLALALAAAVTPADAQTTPWADSYNSKVRLVAGGAAGAVRAPQIAAGVEIAMAPGWKTYWRIPGDAGGVPPRFDWSASGNVAALTVLYPAPYRLQDAAGESVGYKGRVLFPLMITAKNPAQPVELKLALEYGICREICVPAEVKLDMTIEAGHEAAPPPELATALERVPRPAAQRRPTDPEFKRGTASLSGDKPTLIIEAAFPGGAAGADLFIEAPEDIYVPLPTKVGDGDAGAVRFVVDLATGVEPAELKGKALVLTLVSDAGQSEATWKID